jgi:hypothetical protein
VSELGEEKDSENILHLASSAIVVRKFAVSLTQQKRRRAVNVALDDNTLELLQVTMNAGGGALSVHLQFWECCSALHHGGHHAPWRHDLFCFRAAYALDVIHLVMLVLGFDRLRS